MTPFEFYCIINQFLSEERIAVVEEWLKDYEMSMIDWGGLEVSAPVYPDEDGDVLGAHLQVGEGSLPRAKLRKGKSCIYYHYYYLGLALGMMTGPRQMTSGAHIS